MALFQNYYNFVNVSSNFQHQIENSKLPSIISTDIKDEKEQASTSQKSKIRASARRGKFTFHQTSMLEAFYSKNNYIKSEERKILAQTTNLTELQIKYWFQNRRARDRKKIKKEEDKYILSLIQNTSTESFINLLQFPSDNFYYYKQNLLEVPPEATNLFSCPHEHFHNKNIQCPCVHIN